MNILLALPDVGIASFFEDQTVIWYTKNSESDSYGGNTAFDVLH